MNTDVVIIGGGASGAYGAVRVQDMGKKFLLIEKEDRLGGHTSTWRDPVTGNPFDYGVEVFMNMTISRDFFARFNVATQAPVFGASQTLYADFRDGQVVNYTAPSQEEMNAALRRLAVEWNKYESMILPTSSGFPAGNQIPEDLLLPWAEFARKYDVEAATSRIWGAVVIDPRTSRMIDMWKGMDPSVLRGTMQPVSSNNSEIFGKMTEYLGQNVWFESQVVSSKRSAKGVQLQVRRKDGSMTTINAKRLLISAGPETLTREVFDLDATEEKLLHSHTGDRYFVGIVAHPSLPAYAVFNSLPEAAPANHGITPVIPFLQSFNFIGNSSSGPLYRVVVATPMSMNMDGAKDVVRTSLQKMMDAGTLPTGDINRLDFKSFDDHGMLYRRWTVDQMRGDIIRQVNALQGLRSTWYTGAAWAAHNAAMLWNTTETILPRVLQGI